MEQIEVLITLSAKWQSFTLDVHGFHFVVSRSTSDTAIMCNGNHAHNITGYTQHDNSNLLKFVASDKWKKVPTEV